MLMLDRCYVCTTPYQIIAAIAISCNERKHSDLLIVPQFLAADEYADRIRGFDLFSSVTVVDTSGIEAYKKRANKLTYGFGIVKNYIFLNSLVHQIIGEKNYKEIYISSQANIGRLISLYYRKRGAEIVFFDDGEGSYDDNKIYEAQGIDRMIRAALFGKEAIRLGNRRQLYCPGLYRKTFGDKDEVTPIPNWLYNKELLGIMNKISGYSDEAKIREKFILLDTIPNESFDEEGQKKYEALFEICAEALTDKLLVKKHPRDNREYKKNCAIYKYPAIPFEIICANSDINSKVLISAGSSAVLMPKILFDSEPVVILLHHITGNRLGDADKREKMINHVKELYKDKSKFIVPETIDEFKEIIKKLNN